MEIPIIGKTILILKWCPISWTSLWKPLLYIYYTRPVSLNTHVCYINPLTTVYCNYDHSLVMHQAIAFHNTGPISIWSEYCLILTYSESDTDLKKYNRLLKGLNHTFLTLKYQIQEFQNNDLVLEVRWDFIRPQAPLNYDIRAIGVDQNNWLNILRPRQNGCHFADDIF